MPLGRVQCDVQCLSGDKDDRSLKTSEMHKPVRTMETTTEQVRRLTLRGGTLQQSTCTRGVRLLKKHICALFKISIISFKSFIYASLTLKKQLWFVPLSIK